MNSRPSVYKTAALLLKLNQLTKRDRDLLRGQAPARHIGQADVFRSLPDRGFEAGEAGRAGLTRIRAPATRRPLLAVSAVSARSLPG